MTHVPVLLKESIALLSPKEGEAVIDGTAGSGGHAAEILKNIGSRGKLLLVDWDEKNVAALQKKFSGPNIKVVRGNYADLPEIMAGNDFPKADGLLLDLGFSSEQLENRNRGFSFLKAEPLLMTYSDESMPLKEFLDEVSIPELTEIIKKFGEERYAKKIAEAIISHKSAIADTKDLAEVIRRAVPLSYERGRRHGGASRIHPATRTFQALRIYLNKELANLERVLQNLDRVLKPDGRVAVISFHSLEDRIVKNQFRQLVKEGRLKILTKKPVTAGAEELQINPRARSAKLRAAIVS